jgi:predicted ATPase with chaperone activity
MRLPIPLIEELLLEMARDHFLEILGLESPSNHRYAVAGRGHERVSRLLQASSYAGPAPVTLQAYAAMISCEKQRFPEITLDDVRASLSDLVLAADQTLVVALAVTSGRSLFLWGPTGNGKTAVAHAVHRAQQGALWIPHCIDVGGEVIQVYDPHVHQQVPIELNSPWEADQRWVRIRRPLIVAGGEMTLDSIELSFSPTLGLYELPLHAKANGGTFVIDDFGRQRVDPTALLNRWIVPMEHGFDYLTLRSGRKIVVPFDHLLIVATNIQPDKVIDAAFLRRLGYRAEITYPDEERYCQIFRDYAKQLGWQVPADVLPHVLQRYRDEGRELRACEPRDLLNRVGDICRMQHQPLQLTRPLLDIAWSGYFGTPQRAD